MPKLTLKMPEALKTSEMVSSHRGAQAKPPNTPPAAATTKNGESSDDESGRAIKRLRTMTDTITKLRTHVSVEIDNAICDLHSAGKDLFASQQAENPIRAENSRLITENSKLKEELTQLRSSFDTKVMDLERKRAAEVKRGVWLEIEKTEAQEAIGNLKTSVSKLEEDLKQAVQATETSDEKLRATEARNDELKSDKMDLHHRVLVLEAQLKEKEAKYAVDRDAAQHLKELKTQWAAINNLIGGVAQNSAGDTEMKDEDGDVHGLKDED